MNKLVATTLESKFHVFDMKTLHPELGYTGLTELAHKSTIWGVKHVPQNRDLFITQGGNGSVNLYKYSYPVKRVIKDETGINKGVTGSLELLNDKIISTQPIISWDWSKDKLGLACLSCLDQTCKVAIITKLNTF
jgi:WD repeat-containing protein 92